VGSDLGRNPHSLTYSSAQTMPMNPRLLRPLARQAAAPPEPPADPFATLVSTKSTDNISGLARSTTGYIKVEWWDSTTNVYGAGVAGNDITWSKAAGGAGSKTLRIYPSDTSGNLSGSLTHLDCNIDSLTSLNVSGCTALAHLNCYANSLTSLNVSGLTALAHLDCQNNTLTALNASGCTALTHLDCNTNSLTSLDVSGCTALAYLDCQNNSLTSLDVSGLTNLAFLVCNNNALTSLRAVGVGALTQGKYYSSYFYIGGIRLRDNNLSVAALNQFYTDLATTGMGAYPGILLVRGNPGTNGDNTSIATAKGWTVYGS
jgi:hypothetical protein